MIYGKYKSAKKAILVHRRNRARNLGIRTRMKTMIKAALDAISNKSADRQDVVIAELKTIDKTVSKVVMKKNTAAR